MSAPGSPGSPASRRRKAPAAPLQLFPTSYVDLDLPDPAASAPAGDAAATAAHIPQAASALPAGVLPTHAAPGVAVGGDRGGGLPDPHGAGRFYNPQAAPHQSHSPLSPPGSFSSPTVGSVPTASSLHYLTPSAADALGLASPTLHPPSHTVAAPTAGGGHLHPSHAAVLPAQQHHHQHPQFSAHGGGHLLPPQHHQHQHQQILTPPSSSYSPSLVAPAGAATTFLVPSPSLSAPNSSDSSAGSFFSPVPPSSQHGVVPATVASPQQYYHQAPPGALLSPPLSQSHGSVQMVMPQTFVEQQGIPTMIPQPSPFHAHQAAVPGAHGADSHIHAPRQQQQYQPVFEEAPTDSQQHQQYEPVFEDAPPRSQQQRHELGAANYEPIFEDSSPYNTNSATQPKQKAGHVTEDDDDLGLYNKPKRTTLSPSMEMAGGDESASVSSLFATSASSLRQRRGGSESAGTDTNQSWSDGDLQDKHPAGSAGTRSNRAGSAGARKRPASKSRHWHWPWVSRIIGVLLFSYFGTIAYRCYIRDGFEGLVDTAFNLQLFVLLAALGMMLLSRNLIGTSLVMLSYYHLSWWADAVYWVTTGSFFFGTAVSLASLSLDSLSHDFFTLADLAYHALFVPLCFLVLYKNGGVTWRAGLWSIVLHALLFSLSTTHQLPLPLPSLTGHAPFAYRSANLYELGYNHPNSPPYRLFMEAAPKHLQQAADSIVPLLEDQGIHLNVERAPQQIDGGASADSIMLPSWIYAILFISLCNLAAFVVLKLLSCILLQRSSSANKTKAE